MPRWIALCLVPILASSAMGAPVPKPQAFDAAEQDRLWQQFRTGSDFELTVAVCRLLTQPDAAVKLFAAKLQPLAATKKQIERLIAALDTEDGWKGASEVLSTLDPRLALPIEDCWALAKTDAQKRRLAWVLCESVFEGSEESLFELVPPKGEEKRWQLEWRPKPGAARTNGNSHSVYVSKDVVELRGESRKWNVEIYAVTMLNRIGTPAAWRLLEAMATGHKDARPTIYSQNLVESHKTGWPPLPRRPVGGYLIEQRERDWDALKTNASREGRVEAIVGLLWDDPAQTLAFIKTKLAPLKLDKKRADQLVAKLFGDKEAEWKGAVAEFAKVDIRLAYPVQDAWNLARTDDQRTKMAMVLLFDGAKDCEDLRYFDVEQLPAVPKPELPSDGVERSGLSFKLIRKEGAPAEMIERHKNHPIKEFALGGLADLNEFVWHPHASAIHLLEAIGTPEALALIADMATGHPDAAPTKVAKDMLKRRNR